MTNIPIPILILCGGKATRLGNLTETIPKSLIEIAGKPFIEHQIHLLKIKHFKNIVLCLGHYGDQIRDFVINNNRFGLNIQFSYDGLYPLGTGGAVKKAIRYFGKSVFVTYGDSYLPDINYHELFSILERSNKESLLTIYKNNNEFIKSNISLSENGQEILEYNKNSNNSSIMQYCDYGVILLKKGSITTRFRRKLSFDLSELIQSLIEEKNIIPYIIKNRFYEIGSLQGIKDLEDYLSKGKKINE